MIRGAVSPLGHLMIPLMLHGANGTLDRVDALLDTGFNGSVVLPGETVVRLGLRRIGGQRNQVADGRWVWMDAYHARIIWDGQTRTLVVLAAGDVPLIGTYLLQGFRLIADVQNGGDVTIERLTQHAPSE